MTRHSRSKFVAIVLGMVTGAAFCSFWSAFIWQSSWWFAFGLGGAAGGAFGGFLKQTLVEATFIAAFSLIGLIGLHQSCQNPWGQVAFALIAGAVAGTLGGSFASSLGQRLDTSNHNPGDNHSNS